MKVILTENQFDMLINEGNKNYNALLKIKLISNTNEQYNNKLNFMAQLIKLTKNYQLPVAIEFQNNEWYNNQGEHISIDEYERSLFPDYEFKRKRSRRIHKNNDDLTPNIGGNDQPL
jgi:hypothetical protein